VGSLLRTAGGADVEELKRLTVGERAGRGEDRAGPRAASHRRDPRGFGPGDGGPGGPGGRTPLRGGSSRPEADHPDGQLPRAARDHRDPDARIDDARTPVPPGPRPPTWPTPFSTVRTPSCCRERRLGKYPGGRCVRLHRIVEEIEGSGVLESGPRTWWTRPAERRSGATPREHAIASATVEAVRSLHAPAALVITRSGFSARLVSSHRPPVPIYAVTTDPRTCRQLAPVWGVRPLLAE
jgi:hypothetical protein